MTSVLALDFDGTLVDCRQRQLSVLAEVARAEGTILDRRSLDLHWTFKREGASTRDALVRAGYEPAFSKRVADAWVRVIEDPHFLTLDAVLPGTLEALATLRARGYTLRVLTARAHVERVVAQVAHLLGYRIDSVEVVSPSHASEAKATLLEAWSAAAFVGDTESDARAAQAAHVPFYAMSSGQRSEVYLHALGLRVFSTLEEVARALP